MRNFAVPVLLGLSLLAIAIVVRYGLLARANPGRPINSAMRQALEGSGQMELSAEDTLLVDSQFPGKHTQKSGLMYVPRAAGKGPTPDVGDELVVHYEGRLLEGSVFDSSRAAHGDQPGQPLRFRVGLGQVIKGWDEAFLNMRAGDKRTLIIPYWLAYGVQGRPPRIPPRATLIFDVELLEIHHGK
ncbi:peptidylprolyl isomerase [Cephaloticoccus primus]|uniref:Peptidyl-prolyl cis-trans isomerase n=1 Tax=Cephaloticoccus primus TaxID=1548207 RepID=A0A139SLA9_9BACT|nr:FKBP-type peptidyl-prolyl cis-trans isomerase [Cephaloticoccus primus]KXU35327.1 peptidylprolyl isomerase [Cephaloticoccus primus]